MIYSLTASSRHLCCILQPSRSSSSKKKHPGTEKMQGFIHKKLAKFELARISKQTSFRGNTWWQVRRPQPCCSPRSVNLSHVPSARYFQTSCWGLERLSILKWTGECIRCWQRFWKMLAKWGLKVNTERKDDFLNYTSCEQTVWAGTRPCVWDCVSQRSKQQQQHWFPLSVSFWWIFF